MGSKLVRQFISFIVTLTQVLVWAQPAFSAPTAAAVTREMVDALATTRSATLNGLPNVPTRFKQTKIAGAVDRYTTEAGQVKNGAYQANIVKNGTEVVGQAELAAPGKLNAVSMIRRMAKSKTGKFVMNFPAEALLFFTALGAISKMQLWSDFADNPVSWEQHVMAHDFTTPEGQLGYVGIAAFILTSRGTESTLYNLIGNSPNGRYFTPLVPYAGMSMGLLVSTIVHEVHNFPQMKACTAALEKRIADDEKWAECERAYDSFRELGYEKLQSLMPTLFAMFSSTVLAGVIESMTVRKVFTVVGWQILWNHKATVAELGSLLTPGGWGIRGARFLYRVSQFVGQTLIQTWQEPAFTTWWKNFSDGSDLSDLETDIMNQLDRKKRISWNTKTPGQFGDLYLSLAKLSQYAMDWRKGNLHYTIIKHQNWLQYLTHFSAMYTASMNYYNYYINEYRNRYINRVPSKLDEVYPFAGIEPLVPENAAAAPSELGNKEDYQNMQIQQLIVARAEFEQMIKEDEAEYKKLFPQTIEAFKKFLALLPTPEEYKTSTLRYNEMSQAIDTMNSKLGIKFDAGTPFYLTSNAELRSKVEAMQMNIEEIKANPNLSDQEKAKEIAEIEQVLVEDIDKKNQNKSEAYTDERELYSHLRKLLGNPMPIKIPGYGFLKAYQESGEEKGLGALKYPKTEMMTDKKNNAGINGFYSKVNTTSQFLGFSDENSTPWTSQSNTIVYHHPSQYIAAQVAFGPRADLKQSTIGFNRRGFPVQFNPPRLVDSFSYDIQFNETPKISGNTKATIFNTPVIAIGSERIKYNNIFEITRAQNVLPGIINHKDGFIGWWKEYVESQYAEAWSKFEDEYQRIMVEIYEQYKYHYKGYHLKDYWETFRKSGFSSGAPLSNGIQLSFRQERRLYLLILGEILKDHANSIDTKNPLLSIGSKNEKIQDNVFELKWAPVAKRIDTDLVNYYCHNLDTQEQKFCQKNVEERKQTAKRMSTGTPLEEIIRGNASHVWPKYSTPFIKILDHLKSTENYSYSSILRSYHSGDIIPTKDRFSENKFKFQENIELLFQNLEAIMDKMQLQEVVTNNITIPNETGEPVTFETTKKIISSTITNQQLREAQDRIEKLLDENQEQFKNIFSKVNPNVLPIIWTSFKGLRSISQQTAELGRMINAVSYEKSDEKNQQKGNNICDRNTFVTTKIGIAGSRTPFTRKACKKQETPVVTGSAVAADNH